MKYIIMQELSEKIEIPIEQLKVYEEKAIINPHHITDGNVNMYDVEVVEDDLFWYFNGGIVIFDHRDLLRGKEIL